MINLDFTIADVLAWARTKPADETYVFHCNGSCAIAQFLIETGRCLRPNVGGRIPGKGTLWFGDSIRHFAPAEVGEAALAKPHTFGAFADRLAKHIPVSRSDWLSIDAYLTETVTA